MCLKSPEIFKKNHGKTLATDLDGTFIPFDFNKHNAKEKVSRNIVAHDTDKSSSDLTPLELQVNALKQLGDSHQNGCYQLLYVTGRDQQSVSSCIREEQLPEPDFIFCDVGTTLLQRHTSQSRNETIEAKYHLVDLYHRSLHEITNGISARDLATLLDGLDGIELQEFSKQGTFKRSFYCDRERLDVSAAEIRLQLDRNKIPYQVVSSIDPFNGDGLIDVLPRGADKGFAVRWWATEYDFPLAEMVYAGDSGNDLAAFKSGVRSVIVGNASQHVISEVLDYHRSRNTLDRVHIARHSATSGVLEGCRIFGIVD